MATRCTRCYHCGLESAGHIFKYYNNGKQSKARYQCCKCQKLITLGSSGYPGGRSYAKQRNVDPPELMGFRRECRCCGVADNAHFRYYNNRNVSQPRFQCMSCGQQFQMRLMGTGEERRLVHNSPFQRPSNHQMVRLAPNITNKLSCMQPMAVDPWT